MSKLTLIERAWGPETAYRGDWREDNPAWGQCAVTALLVQEIMGGEIVVQRLLYGPDQTPMRHYYNSITTPDGYWKIDLTKSQFGKHSRQILEEKFVNRAQLLRGDLKKRYAVFRENVRGIL